MSRPMYAVPAYELSAEDRAEEAEERRQEAIAERIESLAQEYADKGEVAELVRELYEASGPVLAALERDRADGHYGFGVTTFKQRLLAIVKNVEAEA